MKNLFLGWLSICYWVSDRGDNLRAVKLFDMIVKSFKWSVIDKEESLKKLVQFIPSNTLLRQLPI